MCPFSSLAFLQPTTVDKEPQNFQASPQKKFLYAQAHYSTGILWQLGQLIVENQHHPYLF